VLPRIRGDNKASHVSGSSRFFNMFWIQGAEAHTRHQYLIMGNYRFYVLVFLVPNNISLFL